MSVHKQSLYLKALGDLMKERPEVICVTCGVHTQGLFEEATTLPHGMIALPDTPSAAVAFCAGLAREGMRPFLHAQASMLTRGAYEMILTQLAAPCLPVRLIGLDAGLLHEGGLGAQSIDDLGLLGSLPQMSVFEPGDACELSALPKLIDEIQGPVYLRATLGKVPTLFHDPPRLGHLRVIDEGQELLMISSGRCTAEVLRIKDALKEARISLHHLHVSELNPFPTLALKELLLERSFRAVITMEEHLFPGPLSKAVSTLISETNEFKNALIHVPLALHQTFAQGGSSAYLMRKYGIDAGAVIAAIERSLKRRVGVSVSDLAPSQWS